MAQTAYTGLALYRRLLQAVRTYWGHIAALFALNLLSTPLALLAPLPLRIAVDSAIGSHPLPSLLAACLPKSLAVPGLPALAVAAALTVLITGLVYLHALGAWLLQTSTGEKLLLGFRARLFRHVQRLSLSYHDTQGSADSVYRIQYDAAAIQNIFISGLIPLATSCFTLVGMGWVTLRLDRQLALVALAVAPLLLLLTSRVAPRLRRRWRRVKKLESASMSLVQEVLSATRVVKAFGREDHEHDRFVRQSSERVREQLRVAAVQGGFDLLVGLTIAGGTAAALYIGVLHVRSGALSLGQLLMVIAYIGQLYDPIRTLSKKVADLQSSLASAERVFTLLDEVPEVAERPHARPLGRALGAVSFREVTFSYDGQHPVLTDVSFDVPAGARLGISGRTGAGKSTLLNLLTRFYDPSGGQILLDGVDLRDYRVADLRNQFAIVLQDTVLFSTSIAENIAYARPDASREEIIQAAKLANAHDFIEGLPEGYETEVGERGMLLSGGERQRISVARAFLKDAPILLLDEPTSSIDIRTEALILDAMNRLMRGRTTFIVAHRLNTLEHCDLRISVENGRLVPADSASPATQSAGA